MSGATPPYLAQLRLRHQLEVQSLIIEDTVSAYCRWPLQVSGGDVEANRIWYEMPGASALASPVPMRAIEYDLRRRLGAAAQVSRWDGGLRVAVERPSPPVDLLDLMQQYHIPAMGAVTAVLGLDAGGEPVQLDLARAGHVLIAGGAASGKTSLLQTIVTSLVLANRPGQLQLLVIQNVADNDLQLLDGLSRDFLLRPVVTTAGEAARALSAIAARMELTPALVGRGPHLAIIIDQVEALLAAANFAALEPLVRLLGTSDEMGLTLLVSVRQPQNGLLPYCGDRWGARIVGRMADAAQAEAAVGWPHSRAERLLEDGAFLLARKGERTARYFQAAYADQYDLSFLRRMKDEPSAIMRV